MNCIHDIADDEMCLFCMRPKKGYRFLKFGNGVIHLKKGHIVKLFEFGPGECDAEFVSVVHMGGGGGGSGSSSNGTERGYGGGGGASLIGFIQSIPIQTTPTVLKKKIGDLKYE